MSRITPHVVARGVDYNLSADGRYPIFVDGKVAAWLWRAGREFGVEHGDLTLARMNKVPKTIDLGEVSISFRDEAGALVGESLDGFAFGSSIEFAQRFTEATPGRATFRVDRRDAAFRDFLLGDGPALDLLPVHEFTKFHRWLPNPDTDPDEPGSIRLKVQRHPVAVAILARDLLLEEGPTDEQLDDLERATRFQGLRGYNVFAWLNVKALEEKSLYTGDDAIPFSDFTAFDAYYLRDYVVEGHGPEEGFKPGLVLGQGYRNKSGGFRNLYDRARPEGVMWDSSGLECGASLHMTIDALVFAAVFTRSKSAADAAVAHFQAVASFLWAEERWTSRGYALFFKAAAYLAPMMKYLTKTQQRSIRMSVAKAVADLVALNKDGMPAPDNGETIEGGHLTGDEVYESFGDVVALIFPEKSDKEVREFCSESAESESDFYCALLVTGCDDLVSLWDAFGIWEQFEEGPGVGQDLREAVLGQERLAARFIVNVCAKLQKDVHGGLVGNPRRIPRCGLWSDVGTKFGLAEGGDSSNEIKGTKARFIIGGIGRAALRFGMPELMLAAQTTLGYCNDAAWWNGKDFTEAMLERLWPAGALYGWQGTREVKEPGVGIKAKVATEPFDI